MRLLTLLKQNLALDLSTEMAYKFNFILYFIATSILHLFTPIFALLIYQNSKGFPGWSFWEFILFYGSMAFVWSTSDFFFQGIVGRMNGLISKGDLDMILIKPFRPLAYLSVTSTDFSAISDIFIGAILIVIAIAHLSINYLNFIWFALLIMLAILFIFSMTIIVAAIAFFSVKSFGLYAIITATYEYSRYPLNLYTPAMVFTLSFIIPVGLASFYPASVLLGRIDAFMILKLLISVFTFFGAALLLWKLGMRRYTSAGG